MCKNVTDTNSFELKCIRVAFVLDLERAYEDNLRKIVVSILLHFYRAMHFSAKRDIAIACRLSVCLSVCPSVRPSVCNVGGL